MNVWKLTAVNNLVHASEDPRPEEGKRKVRVTKVFVNGDDSLIYRGEKKVKHPLIPGRFAVGVVADGTNEGAFPKGTRVLLHSYRPERDAGTEKPDFSQYGIRVCGQTEDGFLRDFVYVTEDEMTALPASVNDEKALLIHQLALAKAAAEALRPKRGDHIAIVGADVLGILLCQLLIYQQAAPVLIDWSPARLEFAKSCGVYYTAFPDETLMDNLSAVTGGRLADGAVLATSANMSAHAQEAGLLPFETCAKESNVVFCGLSGENLRLDLNDILKKQLTVHGISDGTEYIEAAINLVANGAIDLSSFRSELILPDALSACLETRLADPDRPVNEIIVVKLI